MSKTITQNNNDIIVTYQGQDPQGDEGEFSLASQLASIVTNVKSFKCADGQYVQGDGAHDDTTGIQAAINSVGYLQSFSGEHTGKVVFFPFGLYRITAPLNMGNNSGVSLRGLDHTKSAIVMDSTLTTSAISITGNNYRGTIKGIRITGQVGALAYKAIDIEGSGNQIYVQDCWINNVQYGIYCNPSSDSNFSNNIFEFVQTPIYINGGNDFDIYGNDFYDCGPVSQGSGEFNPSFWFVNSKRINFHHNRIVTDEPMSSQSGGVIKIDGCTSVKIEDNIEIETPTYVGNEILVNASTAVKVERNILGKAYFSAIKATGVNVKLDINHNTFYGTQNAPYPNIALNGAAFDTVGIRGNTFESGSASHDISADTGKNLLHGENIYKAGIYVDPSVTNVVAGSNLTRQ